jgi:hypothetical protein
LLLSERNSTRQTKIEKHRQIKKNNKKVIKKDNHIKKQKKKFENRTKVIKRFKSIKGGLEGNTEEMIQIHTLRSVSCLRCGRNKDFTTECFGKWCEAGESLGDNKNKDEEKRKVSEKDKGDANKWKPAGIKSDQQKKKDK